MEATVTMPLRQYDSLQSEIIELQDKLDKSESAWYQLDALVRSQSELISELKDFVMEDAKDYSDIKRLDISELLEFHWDRKDVIRGFYTWKSANLKKFGITLDDQRDFITRKYNEYQAELEAEKLQEAANEQALTTEAQ